MFDCFMSALEDLEKNSQPQIKAKDDEAHLKASQLQEIIRQKELLIQSKDQLLAVKDEALRGTKELLAQKDKIIKVWPKQQNRNFTFIKNQNSSNVRLN